MSTSMQVRPLVGDLLSLEAPILCTASKATTELDLGLLTPVPTCIFFFKSSHNDYSPPNE